MMVTVTAQHIAEGMPKEPQSCPIALALGPGWDVGRFHATHDGRGHWLPPEARAFVAAFDAGLDVHPFSFQLEPHKGRIGPCDSSDAMAVAYEQGVVGGE